jgi:hypothetical protein
MKPKRKKSRELRRRVEKAVSRLVDRKPEEKTAEKKPEPKSGTLSHEKSASRQAVRYNPMTAPNSRLVDTRGVPYDIGPKGQLRRERPKLQRTMREIRQSFSGTPKGKGKGTAGEKV